MHTHKLILWAGDVSFLSRRFRFTDLEFELVGVSVLPFVEVDEVVCDPLFASGLHVPADPERVTGDVTDPDLLRDRQVTAVPEARVRRLCPWKTDGALLEFILYIRMLMLI